MAEGNSAALLAKFKELFPNGKMLSKDFKPFVDSLAAEYGNRSSISTASDIGLSKIIKKPAKHMDINAANVEQYYQLMVVEATKHKPKSKDGKSTHEKVLELFLGAKITQNKVTKISTAGGVDRMTDTSKYTGAHKERFDESGKGKGAAGRTDKADTSGYVGGYKGAGTYDKK